MKKIKLFLMFFILMIPAIVKADHIYSIDVDIDIQKNGTANITEVWDVVATGGSEWYKTMYELGGSELSNYVVYMDDKKLNYDDTWDVNGSLEQKRGYYGINNSYDGLELCFGKGDMGRHTFTLKYTVSNYIFNTSDSQVLYWTLIPNITVDNITVDVTSYYQFPDMLGVWGYGYMGYAYVKEGKISIVNETSLINDYVVLLAKFPLNTFDTDYTIKEFETFDDVYKSADEDSYDYDYSDIEDDDIYIDYDNDNDVYYHSDLNFLTGFVVSTFLIFLPFIIFIASLFKFSLNEDSYGYVNNKKINKKDVPMFRDIPCDKDIYYANVLIKLNNFGYNKFNILGAIILKWVRDGKIKFINKEVGIFKKETSVIDLTMNPTFDNGIEMLVFEMMYNASKDGMLEAKEFEKWAQYNYSNFIEVFNTAERRKINYLKDKSHIYKRTNRKECKKQNVMDNKIYDDSVELYGLKKYLEEFSRMDTKEVMEVKLWDEYLMFAYLFGIADKVAKQLKDMYPEILVQNNIDYETIKFVDRVSRRTVDSAKNAQTREEIRRRNEIRREARSSARSYSSGGGGYSRGGGGRSSRGGGSRGSAGGR